MQHLNYKKEPWRIALEECLVKGKSSEGCLLMSEYGLIQARRAAGCLLEPEIGDLVLGAITSPDSAYILCVLERENREKAANISVDGPAVLRTEGSMDLVADRLGMTGAEDLTVNTSNFNLNTVHGRVRFKDFNVKGGFLEAQIEKMKTAARYIDIVAERIIQKVKRSYRRVDDLEESKIGRVRCLVKDLFYVRSGNASIKSQNKVKIDGKKIKLG